MRQYIFTFLLLSCMVLGSCYKEIDMSKYRPDPKVVLNAIIIPDSVVKVSLSQTVFYTETESGEDYLIKDATVSLYINGGFVENLAWTTREYEDYYGTYVTGEYVSQTVPETGDYVRIVADTSIGKAQAEEYILESTAIEDVKLKVVNKGEYWKDLVYEITFTDNPGTDDYYLLTIREKVYMDDELVIDGFVYLDYSYEPLYFINESILDKVFDERYLYADGGAVFSGATIDGKTYTLRIGESFYTHTVIGGDDYPEGREEEIRAERTVYLFKVSEDFFHYRYAIQNLDRGLFSSLRTAGLAEPVRIHSNIENGTGILGTAAPDVYHLDISEYAEDMYSYLYYYY